MTVYVYSHSDRDAIEVFESLDDAMDYADMLDWEANVFEDEWHAIDSDVWIFKKKVWNDASQSDLGGPDGG